MLIQGPYTSAHLKSKAIQDFLKLFQKEIKDCFNGMCTFKHRNVKLTLKIKLTLNILFD